MGYFEYTIHRDNRRNSIAFEHNNEDDTAKQKE